MPLPHLRDELSLLPGPVLADGQRSHTLHDPARNQFFQLDWLTFEVLTRWHLGDPQAIADEVRRETPLQLERDDVQDVIVFCQDNQLLRPEPGRAGQWAGRAQTRHGGLMRQLLHHYLFFRVPLLKPDRWLSRWAPRLDFFFSRRFLWLTLAALAWGLVEVHRQWGSFAATLVDTFSWRGVAAYGLTLAAVKGLHELGHAFTAKRLGCRVPTMGIAFLVMCPVAYTDTNEVWKLDQRHQRLAVAAAGVLTELTVAAWATLAWAALPEGTARTMAFLLATTTWITTLLLNSSPFMRFDGYFLLSDWLGMPNLHERAFALARWDLRERLFDLRADAPEPVAPARRTGLVLFAYATWIYRLSVFLGIAALVYAFVIKAVGILLFIVEIVWFVLFPLQRELKVWRSLGPVLRQRRRAWRTALLAAGAGALLLLPWPIRVGASALLRPAAQLVVFAPRGAQLDKLPVAEGQHVAAGTLLAQMSSPELDSRLKAASATVERLRWQASAGSFDPEERAQWQPLLQALATAESELAGLRAEATRYRPSAPFAGTLRDIDPELQPGTWLSDGEALARLVGDQGETVVTYLDEDDVVRVAVGDDASFRADSGDGPRVKLKVVGIEPDASRTLTEPELASNAGGTIAVREKNGQLQPERPVYRVTLKAIDAEADAARHTWRGTVTIAGRPEVPAWRYLRAAAALVRREAGF